MHDLGSQYLHFDSIVYSSLFRDVTNTAILNDWLLNLEISNQKSGPLKNLVHPITEIAWASIEQEYRQTNSIKNKNLILKLI